MNSVSPVLKFSLVLIYGVIRHCTKSPANPQKSFT